MPLRFPWSKADPPGDDSPGMAEARKRIEKARREGSTELSLSRLQLTTLPEALGQLTALQTLWLDNNQFTTLPEALGQLTALQHLRLDKNQITTLPDALGQLTALQVLWLHNNQLTTLPEVLGRLHALQMLHLHNNQLMTLPEALGELKQLELLILEGNALRELPESLKKLERLRMLTLHGNDALGLPAEVLGPIFVESSASNPPANPREILDYYFASLGKAGEALREMKVLVVGRGGAGKTSVIRRLRGLPCDRQQSETHGIAIEELTLACADGPVAARVWDFGGQHVRGLSTELSAG